MSLCWICFESFLHPHQMKKHISSTHGRLAVICPWCTEREERFSRVHDLRKHVCKKRPTNTEDFPEDFFGEANAFWLCVYPDDFRRLRTPTAYDCDIAWTARRLVTDWIVQVKKPSRTLSQWQSGWEFESQEPPKKRQHTETSASYSPTRSCVAAEALELVEMEFAKGHFKAYFNASSTWYEGQIVVDPSSQSFAECLFQKMSVLATHLSEKRGLRPTTLGQELRGQLLDSAAEAIAAILGVPRTLVTKIVERSGGDSGFASPNLSQSSQTSTPRSTRQSSPVQPPTKTGELPYPFPSFRPIPSYQPTRISPTVKTSSVLSLVSPTPDAPSRSDGSPTPPVTRPSSVQQDDTRTSVANVVSDSCDIPSRNQSQLAEPSGSRLSQASSSSVRVIEEDRPASIANSDPPAQVTDQLDTPPVEENQAKDIRQRATALLKKGAMPLFPPSRRQWDEEEIIVFSQDQVELKWPPKGWKSWSPDQRLMAVEYAAMSLEFSQGQVKIVDKAMLLDKFNFLILPGVPTFKFEKAAAVSHKCRVQNYEMLRTMATTGQGDEDLLTTYEYASVSRNTSTDKLMKAADIKGVPQRLQ